VNGRRAALAGTYGGCMTTPDHLAQIRELLALRAARPRISGENEERYCERIAAELERREQARRRGLIVRVLLREHRLSLRG
jgi:hypothetical protein